MKTLCTCAASALFTSRLVKRFSLSLAASVVFLAMSAGAAGLLSVGPSGLGPLTFNLSPDPTNGFSTLSVGAGAGTITTSAQMDTAVGLLTAAGVNLLLGQSPTVPPSINGIARYNTTGLYLQTRPTGVDYNVLMASLRNNSGADRSLISIDYDLAGLVTADSTIAESPGLWAHRVYYSLTGTAGTWVHIPELDTPDNTTSGHKSAIVTLSAAWEVGANLYILWADDNGPSSDTAPTKEGGWTIDNLAFGFGVCDPPVITTQPRAIVHVESCRATNLTVVATGTGLRYQWFKGTIAIAGATLPTYTIAKAVAADGGAYHVVITNCSTTVATSQPSQVTIDPDNDLPTVVSALALADAFTYVVNFSELMDPASINFQGFHVNPLGGGGLLEMTNAVLANGTNLTLKSDTLRTANAPYELIIDPGLTDCSGNIIADVTTVPLTYEVRLIAVENTPWKYNHAGIDLGLDFIDPVYDDSAANSWSNGVSMFDAKSTPRTTVSGQTVMTQLPLHFGTYVAPNDVPVYYFRTHFTLPSAISQVTGLHLRTFVDDFVAVWLNNNPTPLHADMANGDPDVNHYGYGGGTAIGDANFLPTTGTYSKSPTTLVDGDNFIAAKLFQNTNTSSDITFAIELTAIVTGFKSAAQLTITSGPPGTVNLAWPAGTGALLYEADVVDAVGIGGPTGWSLVSGPSLTDGSFSTASGVTQKFYSLRK